MLQLIIILSVSTIFSLCESASILEKINQKCSIRDDKCMQGLYRSLLQEMSDNGIPELGVPKIDPMDLKNREFNFLGMIKLTVTEGEAKGFKDCHATSYKSDFETHRVMIEFVCDRFTFEGSYKIESTPSLLALSGGINIHGEGNGAIDIENVQLSFDFATEIKKLDDGEIHIIIVPEDSSYDFEVKGKVTVQADNILVGKTEISCEVVNIFNENWQYITNTFGKNVLDKAMDVFFTLSNEFFEKTPAKNWITEDLSAYVKS
ncbi:hypothetical protein PYW08_003296 [Mythimna loreyi]|uniref:Uncharacterized protein n=1 Tax=Mythimna loreyi TaxID=667449 RepID=A0ACC2QTE1_9NEOP|nr:hypothetical protein PYW08_003296 [Mythimna loreyi]